MFDKIQHIGYLTPDLDAAVSWFDQTFGGKSAGGGKLPKIYAVPSGGRNAYVQFGRVETEIIEPEDRKGLFEGTLTMHHVGYVVSDIQRVAVTLVSRGLKFVTDEPATNVMGQQVWYFDASTTNGVMMHLTQLPDQANSSRPGQGLEVEKIIHAGYLVPNLDEAISWYVDRLDGQHVGGGGSLTGGRNAFVNFGQVQVELIEPADLAPLSGAGHAMDHVGYVVEDMTICMGHCRSRGFKFMEGAPITNPIKQQVSYFDSATSMGSRMHLTQLPD